jgi:hypothetical protein
VILKEEAYEDNMTRTSAEAETLKQFDTWLKTLKLEKPVAINTNVAKLCMEQTQFQFRRVYYQHPANIWYSKRQRTFPIHCQLVHGTHGEQAEALFPRVWVRYVADVHKDGELDLLTLLNSQHESINFTCEMENDGKLPFVDNEGLLFKVTASQPTHSGSSSTNPIPQTNTRWQHSRACFTEQ